MTRTCPVSGCHAALGTTRSGNPYLMCPRHYDKVPNDERMKLWRAYGSWQRLERKYLATTSRPRPPALLDARALAISNYIDIRDDCIRKASEGEPQQLEMAR